MKFYSQLLKKSLTEKTFFVECYVFVFLECHVFYTKSFVRNLEWNLNLIFYEMFLAT